MTGSFVVEISVVFFAFEHGGFWAVLHSAFKFLNQACTMAGIHTWFLKSFLCRYVCVYPLHPGPQIISGMI